MKYDNKWEKVNDNIERMKVPEGWLVQSWASGFDSFVGESVKRKVNVFFVPDKSYLWEERENQNQHQL